MATNSQEVYDQSQAIREVSMHLDKEALDHQLDRAIKITSQFLEKNSSTTKTNVLKNVFDDLKQSSQTPRFEITWYEAEEMQQLEDGQIIDYLYHRYRYVVNPTQKIIDSYPPLLQIEPASLCNFRCIFCYQADATFNKKSGGHMGTMGIDLFRSIVDEVEGKVEFITLASRGEPLLAKHLPQMLDYISDKFLIAKLNTNASVLNERLAHSILSSDLTTIVFSADAADEETYSRLRVNGSLSTTLKNIGLFHKIKEDQYPDSKMITRVSGVMYDKEKQDLTSMEEIWGSLVDQVSFVNYLPWENIYLAEPNMVTEACADLWRRMFIWYDGTANPCDSDYKSHLRLGSIKEHSISNLWRSEKFNSLRQKHLDQTRSLCNPCCGCTVV